MSDRVIVLQIPSRWESFKWRYFRIIPIVGLVPFILPRGGMSEFISWQIQLIYQDAIIDGIYNERPFIKNVGRSRY